MLYLFPQIGWAQTCTNPGQTVETAFPVCGATIFTQTTVPNCIGIPTPPPSCSFANNNPYFYKFTVVSSGTLGFIITPLAANNDYDFQLYNITNAASPSEIYTNGSLWKIGNTSAVFGATGCAAGGNGVCLSGNTYSALQNVMAGEKYILVVINFIGSGAGYTLNFTGGTASITETVPINFTYASSNCGNNKIGIKLNRAVKCNSIAANGSDFSLSPANATVLSATSSACGSGQFTTDSITLNLSATLTPGNYTVTVQQGTDGNTLLGVCDEQMVAGQTISFTASTVGSPPAFLQVFPVNCNDMSIRVKFTKSVLCDSIAADGSDFEITGAAPVTILSSTKICSGSPPATDEVLLNIGSPITAGGSYILKAKNGSDNNTTVDLCGLKQSTTDNIAFTVNGTVNAGFTHSIQYGCTNDTVLFYHPGTNTTSWQWNFDDPASGAANTSNSQNPVHIFQSFGVKNVTLTVSNGTCSNTVTIPVNLDNEIVIGYDILPKDSLCLGNNVIFSSTASGLNLTHSWDFGNSMVSNQQNPLPVNYSLPGTYIVTYTIRNNHNCSLTQQKPVTILPLPSAIFSADKVKICENDFVQFNAAATANSSSYVWSFGDGASNVSSLNPQHRYILPSSYIATLTVNDKYCGSDTYSKPISVLDFPKVNLGSDATLCPNTKTTLKAGTNNQFRYLWNTGETTPAITYGLQTKLIKVSVINDICISKDSITVYVLPSCTVYMPSGFTPNGDGKNDVLKALNADLAEDFRLDIFNRYGQKIFTSANPLIGWDGKVNGAAASPGAYVWILKFKEPVNKQYLFLTGTSLLIK